MTGSSPLAHLVAVDEIPPAGLTVEITATEGERQALAALNGLPAVDRLAATLSLRREGRSGISVTGEVEAEVTQTCVVSLEPFPALVRERVDVRFDSPEAIAARRAARAAEPQRDEPPDDPPPLDRVRIDVGALAAEHLTLGLDPYPRKPGALLDDAASTRDETVSPFAVLRNLGRERS